MPQKKLALFIPGFLGVADDWKPLWQELEALGLKESWDFQSLELFRPGSKECLGGDLSFDEWATLIQKTHEADSTYNERVVIGYSLGGRLALALLNQEAKLWQAGIIISAHPGLESEAEKLDRLKSDEKWAQKFEQMNWPELMNEWNDQAVFAKTSSATERHEQNYDRKALALALRNLSLGAQQNYRPYLHSSETPVLWLTGKQDQKFTRLAEALPPNDLRTNLVFEVGGHRLPMQLPKKLARVIANFLSE